MQDPSSEKASIIGVDVAKDSLVTAVYGLSDATKTISNTRAAIQAWLQQLPAGACIAMESTGRYQLELATQAYTAGFSVYVLNAMDVHHYGKSVGQRGKTDRLDAHLIAQYLAHELAHQEANRAARRRTRVRAWKPTPALLAQLRELLQARVHLSTTGAKLAMAFKHMHCIDVQVRALSQHLKQLMTQIDAKVSLLLQSDVQLRDGCKRLRTISGVGPQGAALLAGLFARMDFAHADAVVAFAGLDPRPDDSGASGAVDVCPRRAIRLFAGRCGCLRCRRCAIPCSNPCMKPYASEAYQRLRLWSW